MKEETKLLRSKAKIKGKFESEEYEDEFEEKMKSLRPAKKSSKKSKARDFKNKSIEKETKFSPPAKKTKIIKKLKVGDSN